MGIRVTWAATSRTRQPAHNDGCSQSASDSPASSSARASRCSATTCQLSSVLMLAPVPMMLLGSRPLNQY